ncbi:MAG: prepilin peptidase [Epsilonproteobacteria bacterium]|nr:prepilin peptidase [Campylobacterota bacterium]NPA63798.1 prepilin peptidase [Campylobacterota bacterium]
MEKWIIMGVVGLLGLVIGSFLNVLILRLPQGQSILFPSSHCPGCKEPLKWYHNIPLLSWLFLKGKCSYCKEPISAQYPVIEALTALIFVSVFYKNGINLHSLAVALSFSLLLALSLIDLRYKAVPDSINLLAALIALYASPDIAGNLKNALLVAGAMSMLRFFVSYYVSKKEELRLKKQIAQAPWLQDYYPKYVMIEAMGEGDIIVGFTIGAILGLEATFVAIFLAALLALPASIINKTLHGDKELPFIPFLAAGAFLSYFFARDILEWIGVS